MSLPCLPIPLSPHPDLFGFASRKEKHDRRWAAQRIAPERHVRSLCFLYIRTPTQSIITQTLACRYFPSVQLFNTMPSYLLSSTPFTLPRRQSLISSIFVSKEKHDRRCAAQRLPSQTLATHLEDFLVHRYHEYETRQKSTASWCLLASERSCGECRFCWSFFFLLSFG